MVLRAKRLGQASGGLSDFIWGLGPHESLPGRVLYTSPSSETTILGPGYASWLAGYNDIYGSDSSNIFDLAQNPGGRPRVAKSGRPCMTLTTGSGHLY